MARRLHTKPCTFVNCSGRMILRVDAATPDDAVRQPVARGSIERIGIWKCLGDASHIERAKPNDL